MDQATGFLNKHVVPALTALSENTYLSAIRAGMVSVVPLTIIGGLFIIVAYLPVTGWDKLDRTLSPAAASPGDRHVRPAVRSSCALPSAMTWASSSSRKPSSARRWPP